MDAAIELRNVTKTFGQTAAVKDLNLTIPYGGLYGFIGPNGAGKTTTIRLILSIFFPDSGEISVLGHKSALQARSRIGYLPEERGVYRKMRVGAFLSYIAGLKGVKDLNLGKKVRASLERVGLGGTERKTLRRAVQGHASEGSIAGRRDSQAGPPDTGRAFQRPGPCQHEAIARPRAGRNIGAARPSSFQPT